MDFFKFSENQRFLYDELHQKAPKLAIMYLGSLKVLADQDNPDRFALAAHGIRELMEKLPRYINVAVESPQSQNLNHKVQNLRNSWQSVLNDSQWSNYIWKDNKINLSLEGFLNKTREFFEWVQQERPTRKEKLSNTLQILEPLQQKLPEPLEERKIKEWEQYDKYFNGVSHHGKQSTEVEFKEQLLNLERFILDIFAPRTFDNFAIIDEIIREGEKDA